MSFLEQGTSWLVFIGGGITIASAAIAGITVLASWKANQVRKDLTNSMNGMKTELSGKLDNLALSINNQAQAQTQQGAAIVEVANELKNHLIKYSGEMAAIKTTVEAIKVDTTSTERVSQEGETRRRAHRLNIRQPHSRDNPRRNNKNRNRKRH